MLRDKLHYWFDELGASRQDLPYELVRVFSSETDKEALRQSVELSFDHVDRVLDFRGFLGEDDSDEEQLWYDLLARLDSYSYYAALATPLIRQVLEHKTNFINEKVDKRYRIQWSNEGLANDQLNLALVSERENVIAEARVLASKFSMLEKRYCSLSSSAEFAEWCKYFLSCCADLIHLATRQSLS